MLRADGRRVPGQPRRDRALVPADHIRRPPPGSGSTARPSTTSTASSSRTSPRSTTTRRGSSTTRTATCCRPTRPRSSTTSSTAGPRTEADPVNLCVYGEIEWADGGGPIPATVEIPVTPTQGRRTHRRGRSPGRHPRRRGDREQRTDRPHPGQLHDRRVRPLRRSRQPAGGLPHARDDGLFRLRPRRSPTARPPCSATPSTGTPSTPRTTRTSEADAGLDECNGHETEELGYHYHANQVAENAVLTCFSGETTAARRRTGRRWGPAGRRRVGPAARVTLTHSAGPRRRLGWLNASGEICGSRSHPGRRGRGVDRGCGVHGAAPPAATRSTTSRVDCKASNRALDGRLRSDRARRDAAGSRRVRDLSEAARAVDVHAGAVPHRAGRSRRPDQGVRDRRRRLPAQAVQRRRARAAGPGDPASHRRGRSRRTCSAWAISRSSRQARRSAAPASWSTCRRPSSGCCTT